jgi:hypothetical protein
VIILHLVTEGTAYISLEHDARRVPLVSGDLVVLPHGQAHVMGNGPPVTPMETAAQLSRIVSEGLRLYRFGREGKSRSRLRLHDLRSPTQSDAPRGTAENHQDQYPR